MIDVVAMIIANKREHRSGRGRVCRLLCCRRGLPPFTYAARGLEKRQKDA
eukprot:COSAG03_NODE_18149_length_361_cov_0.545802_2_plen_49_part_01